MQVIPTLAVPNQNLQVVLSNQGVTLNINQRFYGLFIDVFASGRPIVQGALCQNQNFIVRSLYLGFQGDLAWLDNQPDLVQGPSDPSFEGLGARFSLIYFTPADLVVIDPDYGQSV